MVTGGYVNEEWSPARCRLGYNVQVSGPDAFVEIQRRHALPGERIETFSIASVDITWEWLSTSPDHGDPFVTLNTQGRDGRPDGGTLYLDQLRSAPEWLRTIIEKSRPKH